MPYNGDCSCIGNDRAKQKITISAFLITNSLSSFNKIENCKSNIKNENRKNVFLDFCYDDLYLSGFIMSVLRLNAYQYIPNQEQNTLTVHL